MRLFDADFSRIEEDIESLSGPELCERVQILIDGFFTPLADGRQRFVDRFGLAGGSEVLNATAFGERMLNRVWSAAADGHLEEARSSFTEVVAAFRQAEETVARLAQAQQLSPSRSSAKRRQQSVEKDSATAHAVRRK